MTVVAVCKLWTADTNRITLLSLKVFLRSPGINQLIRQKYNRIETKEREELL